MTGPRGPVVGKGTTWLMLGLLGSALCGWQGAAQAQTPVNYPVASPTTPPPNTAVLSLVPRPKDPPLSFGITSGNMGQMQGSPGPGNGAFGTDTVTDTNDDSIIEDVIGPTDTGGPPVPGAPPNFSYFGTLFQNELPAGNRITQLTVDFFAPSSVTNVIANTFLRNDDLQTFAGPLTSTWFIPQQPTIINTLTNGNVWQVTFTENPLFPWDSVNDPSPAHPAFTLLGSGFPEGSDIQFAFTADAADAPEPGLVACAAAMLIGGLGLRWRRRSRS